MIFIDYLDLDVDTKYLHNIFRLQLKLVCFTENPLGNKIII